MMKYLKSYLSLLLLVSFMFFVGGCGGSTVKALQTIDEGLDDLNEDLDEIEETDEYIWRTETHFTDGKRGSYTAQLDDGPVHTRIKEDITMTSRFMVVTGLLESGTEISLSTSVGDIGTTRIIGECDSCDEGGTAVLFGTGSDASLTEAIWFASTSGTVERLSRDHIHIDAYMAVEDMPTRHLVADVYLGAILLDGYIDSN